MSKETVCAIVLDYRAAEKTQKCLLSLNNQGLDTVYVLDNSESKFHTAELRRSIDEIPVGGVDYRIEVLSAGENLGFGRGVNFVLSYDRDSPSPHDYYLLLNNDALAGPSLVDGLLRVLKENPQAALTAPKIVSTVPGREFGIWYHRYLGLLFSQPGKCRFHYFTGCCLLFRKDLVHSTGIFNESFFMYGEDVELGWRLMRQGKKMVCAENVYVEHEYGPSVDRMSFFYEYHITRGHLLLSWKTWKHPVEIPLLLLFKFLGLSGRAIVRSYRHRTWHPLAALLLCCLPLRVRHVKATKLSPQNESH